MADTSATTSSLPVASQSRSVPRILAFLLLFSMLACSGAVFSVSVLGRTVFRFYGFEVECRLLPSEKGKTSLVLAPLGEVTAHTHAAPIELIATLQSINSSKIRELIRGTPKKADLASQFARKARQFGVGFVTKQLVLAMFGGFMAPMVLRIRRFRAYAVGGLLGMSLVGGTLASALSSFNPRAFDTPAYTGTLKEAPWVIQFGKDAFTKIEELSSKLVTVADNLNTLYGRIAAVPERLSREDGYTAFRVLHVSDLHNNLSALDFVREVSSQFQVEFIVDTGDLTDFGSPPETVMVQGIAKLPYPYVFVAGNHDSRAVTDALAKLKNVTVLNGREVDVKGITLLGIPNPASARAGAGNVDTTPAELQANNERLLGLISALPAPPDIVAVHDPKESPLLWGRVPLILCGHMHRIYFEQHASPPPGTPGAPPPPTAPPNFTTLLDNAGTTGAAGLRYFEKEQGVPFSCTVLTFDRAGVPGALPLHTPNAAGIQRKRPVLRAIDQIVLDGSLGQYSISHFTFNAPPSAPHAPTPGRAGSRSAGFQQD